VIHSMDVGLKNLSSSPWASLVGKTIKNLPVMQENLAQSLGLGRSPGEGNGYHSDVLAWRVPWKK